MTHYPPELFEGFTPGDRLNPHSRSARHRKYGYDLAVKNIKEKEMTEYPKEIYKNTHTAHERNTAEEAYELGLKHAESLGDWSNLTQAIRTDMNIDWEKLDGMPANCVNVNGMLFQHKLVRDKAYPADKLSAWYSVDDGLTWESILEEAWDGQEGWNLYIKGEIPLKRKTADHLPLGMGFRGYFPGIGGFEGIVIDEGDGKLALPIAYAPAQNACGVTVLEEYGIGTFQKKEEK